MICVLVWNTFCEIAVPKRAAMISVISLVQDSNEPGIKQYLGTTPASQIAMYRLEPPLSVFDLETFEDDITLKDVPSTLDGHTKIPIGKRKRVSEVLADADLEYISVYIEKLDGMCASCSDYTHTDCVT